MIGSTQLILNQRCSVLFPDVVTVCFNYVPFPYVLYGVEPLNKIYYDYYSTIGNLESYLKYMKAGVVSRSM